MDSKLIEGVEEALRTASAVAVMPRFAALRPNETEIKAGNEPVTIADREAEALIASSLRLLLPQARVVGEEACACRPELLENLGDGAVWVIDPIDGTANFAAGREPFAMMVALLQAGETVGSWILDPLSGRIAIAERGSGAWIDGQRIQQNTDSVDLNHLQGIASDAFIPTERRGLIDRLRSQVRQVDATLRCAGHEYPLVATGARDFALFWRTLVWDHSPGALFLTESGGCVTHLDGLPYRATRPRAGLLLARNPSISASLLDLVRFT